MNLIDAHAHLTFTELAGDIDGVIARSRAAGVTGWVTIGTGNDENRKAVALASKYDGMYAGIGFHPHYAQDITADDLAGLRKLAKSPKVVALGEMGLDFHYNFSKQDAQKHIFREQLEIAAELQLPVIVHSRNAFDETLEVLADYEGRLKRVVFHCYGGTAQQVPMLIAKGIYISFTGVITFKNAQNARDAVAAVPLDKLMIETDCPYMSPDPMRNHKPNEPALMIHTAAKIAQIKGTSLEQVAAATFANTKTFFGIS